MILALTGFDSAAFPLNSGWTNAFDDPTNTRAIVERLFDEWILS